MNLPYLRVDVGESGHSQNTSPNIRCINPQHVFKFYFELQPVVVCFSFDVTSCYLFSNAAGPAYRER